MLHTGRVKRFAALAVLAALLCGCAGGPVRTYTDSQLDAVVQTSTDAERARVLEQYPDAELPDVEVVRYIDGEEWSGTISNCLRDAGWDVSTGMDGGMSMSYDDDEAEEFRVSYFVCQAQYPYDPRRVLNLDRRQLAYLYAYEVQVLQPCLEAHHFIGVTAPPTFAEYLRNDPHWDLYADVKTEASWRAVSRACPPEPPGLYGVEP